MDVVKHVVLVCHLDLVLFDGSDVRNYAPRGANFGHVDFKEEINRCQTVFIIGGRVRGYRGSCGRMFSVPYFIAAEMKYNN
jgi:hypothetical protein